MAQTTYLKNKLLDHSNGKTAYTLPTTLYVGLTSTLPTVSGTNVTEPSGGSYARVAITGSTWNAASGGSVTNASVITFPAATADWVTQNYAVIYDAASGGNLLEWATISTPVGAVGGVDQITIAAGALTKSYS